MEKDDGDKTANNTCDFTIDESENDSESEGEGFGMTY